jgi:hypothetical protein
VPNWLVYPARGFEDEVPLVLLEDPFVLDEEVPFPLVVEEFPLEDMITLI